MERIDEPLRGVRVGLLEARMESELASLVRRHGGVPVSAPALREIERDCTGDVIRVCEAVARGGAVVVLTTGVGLARWLRMADGIGRGRQLRDDLPRSTIVCRGPKPIAVLKREGLPVHVRAETPHTTAELLLALESIDVAGRDAVFVHDGGALHEVVAALARRGARVVEIQPYEWALPEDMGPLRAMVGSLVAGDRRARAHDSGASAAPVRSRRGHGRPRRAVERAAQDRDRRGRAHLRSRPLGARRAAAGRAGSTEDGGDDPGARGVVR